MLSLQANSRKLLGRLVKKLKRQNIIPAVIYGRGFASQNIEIDRINFKKIFNQAGTNTIIDLTVDQKETFKVLINDFQYDQLGGELIHVDFYRIHEKDKVKVNVKIKFLGEAPVVKEKNGVLVRNLNEIEIQALPKDLIHEVSVDLSQLKDFSDLVHIKDIKVSSAVEILNDPNDVVVSVSMPRIEEETKPVVEAGTVEGGATSETPEKKETTEGKKDESK